MHVYLNGGRRPISNASRTLNGHGKRYGQINKAYLYRRRLAVKSAVFKVEERLVDCLPITHKEISHLIRVVPASSRVLEFVRTDWPKHVEDVRLKPFFHRARLSIMGNTTAHPYALPEGYVKELHVGYTGIFRMKELARLWWRNVELKIEQTGRDCRSCQLVALHPGSGQVIHGIAFTSILPKMRRGTTSLLLMHIPGGPRFSTCREIQR